MRTLIITLIILTSVVCSSFASDMKGKVILVVFAHPDDEAAIGQLLVKYGKANKVHLLILTDGKFGVKPGFPTGDTLVQLRQAESVCACKVFGIEPPQFFNYTDGFDTRIGVGAYFKQSRELKQKLTAEIDKLKPDLIITFGPDGDTGHSDHRMSSNMVTEIVLKEGWVERFPVYYLGWTKKDDAKFKMIGGLNTIDEKYFNVSISFSQEDEDQALKALSCYKSQLSPEEINEWQTVERMDTTNRLSFRKLVVLKDQKTEF